MFGAGRKAARLATCLAVLMTSNTLGCKRDRWFDPSREFTPVPRPQNELANDPPVPVNPTIPYAPMESYPLRVGDEIAFTLSVDPQATAGAYRLRVNDQISVEYLHEVSPDHRIRTV